MQATHSTAATAQRQAVAAALEPTTGAGSWHESSFELLEGCCVAELSFDDIDLAMFHSPIAR